MIETERFIVLKGEHFYVLFIWLKFCLFIEELRLSIPKNERIQRTNKDKDRPKNEEQLSQNKAPRKKKPRKKTTKKNKGQTTIIWYNFDFCLIIDTKKLN